MDKLLVCLLVCLTLFGLTSAHSWLQCADYEEENGRAWSADKCRAWPRNYDAAFKGFGYVFGADGGYNYEPTENAPCSPSPPKSSDYTTSYPKATYTPGQRICLAWPPKNHVAAKCNNPNIPDGGTKIYRSGVNPTTDPTLSQFQQNLVYDFGANTGTNGIGFQNCPDFCANADKALCTGCFVIPQDLALGNYAFLWEWGFSGSVYANCFDVQIVANSGNYITATYTKLSADAYLALKASGASDNPTLNSGVTYPTDGSGGGGGGGGMSPLGSAVLAIFIIALVVFIVGSVVGARRGYFTIDTKFPFYHKKLDDTSMHYTAFKD